MTQNAINASENIYLFSERGYVRLLKIMNDDTAWEKWDIIEQNYFRMAEGSAVVAQSPMENLFRGMESLQAGIDSIQAKLDAFPAISATAPAKTPVLIVSPRTSLGKEELRQALLREQACKEIIEMQTQRVQMKRQRPCIEKWLKELDVTRNHLNRLIDRYQTGGLDALLRPKREDAGKRRAVCAEGVRLLKNLYYGETRLTNRQIYQKGLQLAELRGPGYCAACPSRGVCRETSRHGIKFGTYMTALRVLCEEIPAKAPPGETRFQQLSLI